MKLEQIGKYVWYHPGSDPTSVGVTALAPGVERWSMNNREGRQDDIFDVALYADNDDHLAFSIDPENDPVWAESRDELERLLHWANLGIRYQAALEHLGYPNHGAKPTGQDAQEMAAFARLTLREGKE